MVFSVLFPIGFVGLARFVPPLDPANTAEQTAEIFRANTAGIRTGLLLCYLGCVFYLAFGASINAQTRRIPGVPAALCQTSASFLIYVKTGPFAWDGPFSWWLSATEFFLWFVVMTVLTTKAINRQYGSSPVAPDPAGDPAPRPG